ncbi:MAG: hypothetical protein AAGC44_04205 [Planctomycetota bacterium]
MPNLFAPRLLTRTLALLLGLALIPGCGDGLPDVDSVETPEEFIQAMETCLEKFVSAMEKIEDMDSFESNKEDLGEALTRMMDLTLKLESMDHSEYTDDETQRLGEEFQTKLASLEERMQATTEQLQSNPELAQAIEQYVAELLKNHPYTLAQREKREIRMAEFDQRRQQRNAQREAEGRRIDQSRIDNFIQSQGGRQNVAVIVVQDIPRGPGMRVRVEIQRMAQGTPMFTADNPDSPTQTYYLGQAQDLQALANKITFGEVRNIDQASRTITVRYNQ